MLTPGNARRLAARLSAMRGAAMKAGQLMSMDGKGVLPPHFAELLGGLRDSAHHMPATQLVEVLTREYGSGWDKRFKRLSFEPIAAASIGQVHRAQTHEGRVLALKIQYPGVRQSIDSDVANLGLLARTPGLVPAAIDVAPLLARVREQLHRETDYRAEADALTEYRARLGEDPVLWVPAVVTEHCTEHILATEFAPGVPVDRLGDAAQPGQPELAQDQRDRVAHALASLTVREFFEMGLVQTDPNFANYLYDASTGRIALLDFGATEAVVPLRREQLREIGRGLRDGDRARVTAAALDIGFIAGARPARAVAGHHRPDAHGRRAAAPPRAPTTLALRTSSAAPTPAGATSTWARALRARRRRTCCSCSASSRAASCCAHGCARGWMCRRCLRRTCSPGTAFQACAARSSQARMVPNSASGSMGLAMKSSMPASMQRCRSSAKALAVIATMGVVP
jgi:hypothetical protein